MTDLKEMNIKQIRKRIESSSNFLLAAFSLIFLFNFFGTDKISDDDKDNEYREDSFDIEVDRFDRD